MNPAIDPVTPQHLRIHSVDTFGSAVSAVGIQLSLGIGSGILLSGALLKMSPFLSLTVIWMISVFLDPDAAAPGTPAGDRRVERSREREQMSNAHSNRIGGAGGSRSRPQRPPKQRSLRCTPDRAWQTTPIRRVAGYKPASGV
jgi:hypothetical protein